VASVGIEVDEERDRLLVANSNNPFAKGGSGQAKLGVYRLSTGERLAMVDLKAVVANAPPDTTYFANDVAVGADGAAYVTDTRARSGLSGHSRLSGDRSAPVRRFRAERHRLPPGGLSARRGRGVDVQGSRR
jgi:hypothetical protein